MPLSEIDSNARLIPFELRYTEAVPGPAKIAVALGSPPFALIKSTRAFATESSVSLLLIV